MQAQSFQVSLAGLDTPGLPSPSYWLRKLPHLICKFTCPSQCKGGPLQPANTGFHLARRSKAALKNHQALRSLRQENCSLLRRRETLFRVALPAQDSGQIKPIPEDDGYLCPADCRAGAWRCWHGGHAGCHHHASVESVCLHRKQHCGFWKLLGRTVDELREAS